MNNHQKYCSPPINVLKEGAKNIPILGVQNLGWNTVHVHQNLGGGGGMNFTS